MDRTDSFESYISSCVAMATEVRNGIVGMPDISKLDLKEAQFFLLLVKDDAFYDFWCSAAGKSREYIRAVVEAAKSQEAFEQAEAEFRKAEFRYRGAIVKMHP